MEPTTRHGPSPPSQLPGDRCHHGTPEPLPQRSAEAAAALRGAELPRAATAVGRGRGVAGAGAAGLRWDWQIPWVSTGFLALPEASRDWDSHLGGMVNYDCDE